MNFDDLRLDGLEMAVVSNSSTLGISPASGNLGPAAQPPVAVASRAFAYVEGDASVGDAECGADNGEEFVADTCAATTLVIDVPDFANRMERKSIRRKSPNDEEAETLPDTFNLSDEARAEEAHTGRSPYGPQLSFSSGDDLSRRRPPGIVSGTSPSSITSDSSTTEGTRKSIPRRSKRGKNKSRARTHTRTRRFKAVKHSRIVPDETSTASQDDSVKSKGEARHTSGRRTSGGSGRQKDACRSKAREEETKGKLLNNPSQEEIIRLRRENQMLKEAQQQARCE